MLRLREEVFEYGLFPLPRTPSTTANTASITNIKEQDQGNDNKLEAPRFTYPHLYRMTRKFFEAKKTSLLPYRHWIKAATQLLKLDAFYAKLYVIIPSISKL